MAMLARNGTGLDLVGQHGDGFTFQRNIDVHLFSARDQTGLIGLDSM